MGSYSQQSLYEEVRTIRDSTNDVVRRFNRMKMALIEAREFLIVASPRLQVAGGTPPTEIDRILDLIRAAL